MLLLQQRYLTIHFCLGEEIENHLTVLGHKLFERSLIRSLDSHNHLRRRITVTSILQFRLSINGLDIHIDDVTENTHTTVEMFRPNVRNTERAFRLRKSRHIRIQHIEQRTTRRAFPHGLVDYHQHFIRSATGHRRKHGLSAIVLTGKEYQHSQCQTQTVYK